MILWLVRAFFAANALLYGVIAARTRLDPDAAATGLGFALKSPAARAEFLTTYAGLLLGLAAMFVVLAVSSGAHRIGLTIAIVFYLPIVACRIVPPLLASGRFAFAAGATGVELLLLIGAILLRVFADAELNRTV